MFGEDRKFTVEENELLNRMAAGELDGFVGPGIMYRNCYSILLVIQNGIPTKYRQSPNAVFLKKGIIVREFGEMEVVQEWRTEEEKLLFLRAFGDRMNDDDVQEYARTSPPIMKGSILLEEGIWRFYDPDTKDHLVS